MTPHSFFDRFGPVCASHPFSPKPVTRHHAQMAAPEEEPKIRIVCGTCGSEDVGRDAWGDWDVATQSWVLRCVFDYAHCHACDGETRLEEGPVIPSLE